MGNRLASLTANEMYRDKGNMDCEHVIATLRGYESELRAAGIVRLWLFGSTARPDSDIDLLAAFDHTRRISLLDVVGRFVPSKDPIQRFTDILDNQSSSKSFTSGMDLNPYLEDLKTRNATERCMEPRVAEELCPSVPWPSLHGLGNFLRHGYDRVDPGRVWVMIEDDLGPLKAASQRALNRLRQAEEINDSGGTSRLEIGSGAAGIRQQRA